MLQMLSGPTLYRLSVPVSSTIVGTGGIIDVDTHVRLAGGQDLRPYVDAAFMERFSSDLASLDHSIYQEFADSLIQVSDESFSGLVGISLCHFLALYIFLELF